MTRRHLSTRERRRIFEAHGGKCHVCGRAVQPGQAWELEHIIPLALGGADDETNLAPAHKKGCHSRKTAEQDIPAIARAKRREARHIGAKSPSRRPIAGSRNTPFIKHMDGRVSRRSET